MPDSRFFKKSGNFKLGEIAKLTGADLRPAKKKDTLIKDVAALQDAGKGHISFFQNKKYRHEFAACRATACFVEESAVDFAPDGMALLVAKDAYKAYGVFANALYPLPSPKDAAFKDPIAKSAKVGKGTQVSPTAVVGKKAEIGKNCFIAPGVVVGHGVKIGDNCTIGPNVSLEYCILGSNVTVHAGASIGARGFGFAPDAQKPVLIPQLGRVIIGNDVEIGANTSIDRGSGPDTQIGDGTMIDNLVQIAHNVKIGKCCIIVSQVGISGSTVIGDYTALGGQVGLAGHLKIGNFVQIASKSGVMRDIEDKTTVGGIPAVPIKQWHRQTTMLKKLTNKP